MPGIPPREPNPGAMGAAATSINLLGYAITSVGQFVGVFIWVYTILIFAYVLTSWVRLPYSPWLSRIQRFLYDICEPYLRLFRRLLPSFGPIDLSPIVGVIFLVVIRIILVSILNRFR
ncbi:MAG: YggT family protein [Gaiellaceae bacterium]